MHAFQASGDITESNISSKVKNYDEGYVVATPPTPYPEALKSPSGVTKGIVLGMIIDAGFDPIVADKVINCESGYNKDAIGDHGRSYGLWQINLMNPEGKTVHGIGIECATDIVCSTEYAIKLLKSERSWNHWTCYSTSGRESVKTQAP